MIFQLYTLIPENPLIDYPYCGLNYSSGRTIYISEDLITLSSHVHPEDQAVLEDYFLPTTRKFSFDLHQLDELICSYTGQDVFEFYAHFKPDMKRVGLTYEKAPWQNFHEYIDFDNHCQKARDIVLAVYASMDELIPQAFHIT